MLTSVQLKQIVTEARPLVERQLDLAEQIAGLREVVTSAGGDWSQLKALVKAQIQDERDDASDGKRVQRILDKADYANAYADMLGIGNLNEKNSFADDADFDPETGEITEPAIAADQGGEGEPGHGTILPAEPIDREEEGSLETGHLSSGQRPEGDPVNPEAGAVIDVGAGESPATLHPAALNALKLRPYCLHADDLTQCAGVGKKHCAMCLAAHADAEGMSA